MRCWVAAAAVVGFASSAFALVLPAGADFDAYPAAVYHGARRPPDFTGPGRDFRDFRTRIRFGFAHGDIFAGHYVIIGWGCGAGCVDYALGDLKTGRLRSFPVSGEDFPQARIVFRADSRLAVAFWMKDDLNGPCEVEKIVWDGRRYITGPASRFSDQCPDDLPGP